MINRIEYGDSAVRDGIPGSRISVRSLSDDDVESPVERRVLTNHSYTVFGVRFPTVMLVVFGGRVSVPATFVESAVLSKTNHSSLSALSVQVA